MKRPLLLFLNLVILTSCELIDSMVNPINNLEKISEIQDALTRIYYDTNGCNWTNSTNWCTSKPFGEWYGLTTDNEGNVIGINLDGNNLKADDFHLALSEFPHLKSFSINNNPIKSLSLSSNKNIRMLRLENCASSRIHLNSFEHVDIQNCNYLYSIDGSVDTLHVRNCNFDKNTAPFWATSSVVEIENCTMDSCGCHSDNLTFINSSSKDSWSAYTTGRLIIVNSICNGLDSHSFDSNTQIELNNATVNNKKFTVTFMGKDWERIWDSTRTL